MNIRRTFFLCLFWGMCGVVAVPQDSHLQTILDLQWDHDFEERCAKIIMCYESLVSASRLFPKTLHKKIADISLLVKNTRAALIQQFEETSDKLYAEVVKGTGVDGLRLLVGDDEALESVGRSLCYAIAFEYLDKIEQLLARIT